MRIRLTLDITRGRKKGELPEGFEYVVIDDEGNEQPPTQKNRVGFGLPEDEDEDD